MGLTILCRVDYFFYELEIFPTPLPSHGRRGYLGSLPPVSASTFTETAIDQTEVIAVARPYGVETTKYDLLVIEQIPGKNKCWDVTPEHRPWWIPCC
ncbi:DUF3747 domain-containing protein [Synechocystis sp. B12]|nr:DUF3747 domain-containing protein [Synechocystis sp. B12]